MKEKQGISLIVLVITIIVMTILAGAIILTLNNSGLIERASNAVEETNLATVKELTQMAWAEAYASGERTEEGLKAAVDKALEDNKVDTIKYEIEVTTSGVTVELKGETKVKWVQEGLTVTNGSVTLEIGDTIAYDETAGGTITGLTATDWKVLGASDEGELLILSSKYIETDIALGGIELPVDIDLALDDYINGVSKLNKMCEEYGKGNGAIKARSINIEDINKITGYNPDIARYGEGKTDEYGNVVTYLWTGNDDPYLSASNGVEGDMIGTLHFSYFTYFDGEKFVTLRNDGATADEPIEIMTLKTDYYYYYPTTLTTNSDGQQNGISNETKAYKMLMVLADNNSYASYWLASTYIKSGDFDYAYWGMRCVSSNKIDGISFVYSGISAVQEPYGSSRGVRAVVSLASDINVTGSSASGWIF